jgi:hypothetical protein
MLCKLRLKAIDISKNDILKNYGSAIHLFEVRAISNDPERVLIRNNSISESYTG